MNERERIAGETGEIPWRDLQRFFASGRAVAVAPCLDIVEVGLKMTLDNREQVEAWMADGEVGPVTDAQAREWIEANALMRAVVIKPWVLVQPILRSANEGPESP